ncbi:hypothetical protein MIR68_007279 [Amoeboaphelidium protococcarum]|nr:hypothetical protein MIR68_007279 [Amoeboaphelidium protococcarum]
MVDKNLKLINSQLGTGLPLPGALAKGANPQSKFLVTAEKGVEKHFTSNEIKHEHTVYFKDCHDVKYTFASDITCTKIFVEGCKNFSISLAGRIITHTLEVWKCEGNVNVLVQEGTSVQTMQLDLCPGNTTIEYEDSEDFNRLIWSAMGDFKLTFKSHPQHVLETSSRKMADRNSDIKVDSDQFIVRMLKNKLNQSEELLNELIVRLENGFPTTEREARQFELRQEANLQKLAKDLLGDNVVINSAKNKKTAVQGRNDVCNCGSGKKYKKCCGTDAI